MTTPTIQRDPGAGPQRIYLTQPDHIDKKKVEKAALELAAAFLVYRRIVSSKLRTEPRPALGQERGYVRGLWNRLAPVWLRLAAPAIQTAITGTTLGELSQEETEYIAASYAKDLGQYIHETSADALVDGFHDQLAAKWSDVLSWHRAASAYGLDSQQMRSYVRAVINPTATNPNFQLLPDPAKVYLDKALLTRAERIGDHEAWQAMESGKAIAWLVQQRDGRISADAQKEWRTAEDERTCPICRPLDRKRVALDEQWEAQDGRRFWAPGVHPRCRCNIRLVYPEITEDPWSSTVPLQYPGLELVGKAEDEETRRRASADQPRRGGRFAARPVETETEAEPRMSTEQLISDAVRRGIPEEAPKKLGLGQPEKKLGLGRQEKLGLGESKLGLARSMGLGRGAGLARDTETKGVSMVERIRRVKSTPLSRRKVIIYVPGKGYEAVPATDVPEDEIRTPVVAFAHQWRQALEGNNAIDFAVADTADRDISIGKVLDFDFDELGDRAVLPAVIGEPWVLGDIGSLFDKASREYGDAKVFKDEAVQHAMNEYYRAWEDWFMDLPESSQEIFSSMSDSDRIAVAQDTARQWGQKPDINDALRLFSENVGYGTDMGFHFMHSFADMAERKYAHIALDENSQVGRRLIDAREALVGVLMNNQPNTLKANRTSYPHTPTIFVVPEPREEDPFDAKTGMIGFTGKYQVYKTELQHSNIHYAIAQGDAGKRPDNIQAIRMVYLRPVDEDTDDDDLPTYGNKHKDRPVREDNWVENHEGQEQISAKLASEYQAERRRRKMKD